MNYAEYVPTPAEWVEIETKNRLDQTCLHDQLLHDLLDLGREVIAVQKRKTHVQDFNLAGDIRAIDPRDHPDLTIPFDRLARAIRMAILLHQKILDLLKPPPAEPTPDQPAHDRTADIPQRPDKIIVKACQDIAASLGPNFTIPDTGPWAAMEMLRTHLNADLQWSPPS
jgi:hypothetical protein